MQYTDYRTLLYSDTLVPDIFLSEYLPALKGDYIKIYLYCLFLVGKNRNPSVQDLSHILDLPIDTVKKALQFMDNMNILSWTEEGVIVKDLKEIEINRLYRPKTTSLPEEASDKSRLHIRRRQVTEAINNTFFSGVMSPSWYGDIDIWFDQFGFDEDVMLLLFRHCRDNGGLSKHYIAKVAENMHSKGVKNSFDFDRYIREYQEMKTVSAKISKKLQHGKRLNEYQEEYVDKWTNKFGFSFDIIDLALRKTEDKPDAAYRYFDRILTRWHEEGLNTVDKILADHKRYKAETENAAALRNGTGAQSGGAYKKYPAAGRTRAHSGFEQREYDDETLEQFVTSEFGGEAVPGVAEEKTDGDK